MSSKQPLRFADCSHKHVGRHQDEQTQRQYIPNFIQHRSVHVQMRQVVGEVRDLGDEPAERGGKNRFTGFGKNRNKGYCAQG